MKGFKTLDFGENMNIAICDDIKMDRDFMKELLSECAPEAEIKTFKSAAEFLSDNNEFDLLYLDVRMPEMNGIEAAERIRKRFSDTLIIFVSSSKEYAYEAYGVEAFQYILKPIDKERFVSVFKSAYMNFLDKIKKTSDRVLITAGGRKLNIFQSDIFYVENRLKKLIIHTIKEDFEIYSSMDKFKRGLNDSFYRCHRGYLVNLSHIREYNTNEIILDNGEKIYMSKDRYHDFVNAYMEHLQKED